MAAQPLTPHKGSVILTQFAEKQRLAREAAARRELSAVQQKSFAAAQLNRLTSSCLLYTSPSPRD